MLLVVGVLTGAALFVADLVRALTVEHEIDFVRASSYRDCRSTGEVTIPASVQTDLTGRHILIVEDIVDTGRTMCRLLEHLQDAGAASLAICTLLDKPSRRCEPVSVHFCGFTIDDHYVYGYGLDLNGRYRGLPHIAYVPRN